MPERDEGRWGEMKLNGNPGRLAARDETVEDVVGAITGVGWASTWNTNVVESGVEIDVIDDTTQEKSSSISLTI